VRFSLGRRLLCTMKLYVHVHKYMQMIRPPCWPQAILRHCCRSCFTFGCKYVSTCHSRKHRLGIPRWYSRRRQRESRSSYWEILRQSIAVSGPKSGCNVNRVVTERAVWARSIHLVLNAQVLTLCTLLDEVCKLILSRYCNSYYSGV